MLLHNLLLAWDGALKSWKIRPLAVAHGCVADRFGTLPVRLFGVAEDQFPEAGLVNPSLWRAIGVTRNPVVVLML